MRKLFSRRPSPALAVAFAALFVSLGGVSYGVATGSIDSREIRDGSIQGKDVRERTLSGTKILQDKVGPNAVKEESLDGSKIREVDAKLFGGRAPRDFDTRWVLVNAAGQIEQQSGGFTVVSGYQPNPPAAAGNVYINANEDLTNKGVVASLGLQNGMDVDGNGNMNGRAPGSDENAEFSGEITASICALPGLVGCAPPGANNNNTFVVSPRLSDGQVTEAGNRKRFYVAITG